jgi:hypothetical protein
VSSALRADRAGRLSNSGAPLVDDRYLRIPAGWTRREAPVADRGLESLNWADSARRPNGRKSRDSGRQSRIPLGAEAARSTRLAPADGRQGRKAALPNRLNRKISIQNIVGFRSMPTDPAASEDRTYLLYLQ